MSRSLVIWMVGGALVALTISLYARGNLDRPLSAIGLNLNPCIQTAFGATFCGDSAESYCESLDDLAPPACNEWIPGAGESEETDAGTEADGFDESFETETESTPSDDAFFECLKAAETDTEIAACAE